MFGKHKIGKYKTVTQLISLLVLLFAGGLGEFMGEHLAVKIINYAGLGLFALATLLTVISGINYIVKNAKVLKV